MSSQPHDMYYNENPQRSPGSHRQQSHTALRQQARPFESYGPLPSSNIYSPEEHAAQGGYMPRYPDRMNAATLGSNYPAYDPWGGSFGGPSQSNTLAAIGASNRMKPPGNRIGRSGLPTTWLEQPMPHMGQFPGMDHHNLSHSSLRQDLDMSSGGPEEDLIPTAIVIKNIPFAVKKEQLVQLMTEMGLPLPYAFNYHFDNGIFRGLAFANFTTPDETAVVIETLNHFDLSGRKLRVEYKKMLPQAERERIEREKRIKRGQLEEQHRPIPSSQLQNQPSLSSLSSQLPEISPSPISSRPMNPGMAQSKDPRSTLPPELDFNDPNVLNLYSQLLLFKEDTSRESLILPPTLAPAQRRVAHTIAHHWRLAHVSKGTGEQRAVHIFRYPEGASISPPADMPSHANDPHRRALNRAATTDFSDVRSEGFYGTLGRQSSGLLGFPDSPRDFQNLRSAKSYADLRSYTPSPVPSTASFPANLSTNLARFADYGLGSTGQSNPNLTSTTLGGREENLLVNGMNTMNLGNGFGPGGSPRSIRNVWERDAPGPIGSQRSFSTTNQSLEDQSRNQGLPQRQPRGPGGLQQGSGFGRPQRQNGHSSARGSDELSSQPGVEVLVEQ